MITQFLPDFTAHRTLLLETPTRSPRKVCRFGLFRYFIVIIHID